MYLYESVSLLISECVACLCVCVFVCVISNNSTSNKSYYVPNLSKLYALLHKTHIEVLVVLQGSTCVDP